MKLANYEGKSLQSTSKAVVIFLFFIKSYFALTVVAFIFCQGKIPRRKYIKIYPIDSMSSRLLCSNPLCVPIEAYLAVPVNSFPYL